jgi:hypothetical protein
MCTIDNNKVGMLTCSNAAAISDVGVEKGCPAWNVRVTVPPLAEIRYGK